LQGFDSKSIYKKKLNNYLSNPAKNIGRVFDTKTIYKKKLNKYLSNQAKNIGRVSILNPYLKISSITSFQTQPIILAGFRY
jgi:hypothetical protein